MTQLQLPTVSSIDYYDAFRKLYYHLYSNSSTSRAERIISDISKLLLIVLDSDSEENRNYIVAFLDEKATANSSLLKIIKNRYSNIFDEGDRFGTDDSSLREGLAAIEKLDLRNAPSHMLGDAFQALMGPNLRGDKGQFFTPKSVVRCMVEVLKPSPNSRVVDPACGTGGFLTEVSSYWERNRLSHGTLIGIDKDKDLYILASALLRIASSADSYVINQNSLDVKRLKKLKHQAVIDNADYVFTNPPFGAKIPVKDPEILSQFSLGFVWEYSKANDQWFQTDILRVSQDPQVLFIELCMKMLKDKGKLGIVLPEGIFGNKRSGYIWDYLYGSGKILGLIDCPRTTFQPGTDTKTNILLFQKNKKHNNSGKKKIRTKIAVALNCGHDRRGKAISAKQGSFANDFQEIAKDWFLDEHEFCFDADIINPYYVVPRYYDRKTDLLLKADARSIFADAEVTTFLEMIEKDWITIRKGNEVGSDSYGTGDVPFVRTSDISNFEISIDPTKSVSQSVYEKYAREQRLKPGDILMVVDGRYRIGRAAILHEFNYQCVVQSHLRIISVNKEKSPLSPFELLYLLSLTSVQRDIRSLVFIQSTLGSLGSRIKELKIPLPKSKNKEFSNTIKQFKYSLQTRAELLSTLSELDKQSLSL